MELSENNFNRLKKLKELNEASSYAEVMKEAIRLYEFMLLEELEGSNFYVKESNGELVRLRIFK